MIKPPRRYAALLIKPPRRYAPPLLVQGGELIDTNHLIGSIAVLQTIEVEVDAQGGIHLLQPLPQVRERRALLTLVVPEPSTVQAGSENIQSLFGLLKAQRGASLDAMDTAIRERARARFNDRD